MKKLTENFFLEEFTQSDTAVRRGLDNTPSALVIKNLTLLAEKLEEVRSLLGFPIFISSGFRSLYVNKAVGGSPTSAHVFGYAADFTCRKFGTPQQIVKSIKASGITYDQLIAEGGKDGWVHIAISPTMRQQTLTATFINGKAVYTKFA